MRSPGGCPWDLEQTAQTLKPFLLEEAHEVADALDRNDPADLCEELGDLLLNVFLQARIAEELGQFTLAEVADGISEKLIRRHPHVFGGAEAADSAAVRKRWEEIKRHEKGVGPAAPESALRPLPASLPALLQAERVGSMAADVGFDWPDADGPLRKVEEELAELRQARAEGDPVRIEEEFGDVLFALTSVGRHLGIDTERSLRAALERFRARFRRIERHLRPNGSQDPADLEALWERAKRADPSPGA